MTRIKTTAILPTKLVKMSKWIILLPCVSQTCDIITIDFITSGKDIQIIMGVIANLILYFACHLKHILAIYELLLSPLLNNSIFGSTPLNDLFYICVLLSISLLIKFSKYCISVFSIQAIYVALTYDIRKLAYTFPMVC